MSAIPPQLRKQLQCVDMKSSTILNQYLIDNLRQTRYTRWYNNEQTSFKVNSLDWLPNGERLLVSGDDKHLRIFDLECEELRVIPSAKHGCDLAKLMPDGNTAAFASLVDNPQNDTNCHKIRHLDLHKGVFIRYFSGHDERVTSISVNPNHNCLLSSSLDSTVRLWDTRLNAGTKTGDRQAFAVLKNAYRPIASFDPNGIIFAVGAHNESVRLYDLRAFGRGPFIVNRLTEDASNGEWHQLRFSPDGKAIAISTSGTKMPIIDSYSLQPKTALSGMKNELKVNLEITWSSDSQLLFCGSSTSFPKIGDYGFLNMFGVDGRHLKCWKTSHGAPTRCVSFNPKYYAIAIACEDVSLWMPGVDKIIYTAKSLPELQIDKVSAGNSLCESRMATLSTVYKQPSIQMSRMATDFNEVNALGSGGFGTVFKCECKADHNLYAIKKVCFKMDKREAVDKELNILSQLDSKFAVKYIDSWVESNYYIGLFKNEIPQNISSGNLLFNPYSPYLLHIQMELCALTLRDVIKIIIKECLTEKEKTVSLIGYYVAIELFIEILECVQYLHSENPAIIHRDLKPENILITYSRDNRFVKLTDFGLSTFQLFEGQNHTINMGSFTYRAPEVDYSKNYTTKTDIYSLGVILRELFSFDFSDGNTQQKYLSILKPRINKTIDLTEKLTSLSAANRPKCDAILKDFELLRLTDSEIKSDKSFMNIVNNSSNSYSIDNQFIEFFVHNKYKFSARQVIYEFDNQHKKRNITSKTIVDDKEIIADNSDIMLNTVPNPPLLMTLNTLESMELNVNYNA